MPNAGETTLTARAAGCTDESRIRKVEQFNEDYRMKESGDVLNWFEIETPEGYFSINDKIGEIMANPRGARCMKRILLGIFWKHRKQLKKKKGGSKDKSRSNTGAVKDFVYGFSVKRAISMMGTMGN